VYPLMQLVDDHPVEAWTSTHSPGFRRALAASLDGLSKKRKKKAVATFFKLCVALFDGARAKWIRRATLIRPQPPGPVAPEDSGPPQVATQVPLDPSPPRQPPPADLKKRPSRSTRPAGSASLVPSRQITEFFDHSRTRDSSANEPTVLRPPRGPAAKRTHRATHPDKPRLPALPLHAYFTKVGHPTRQLAATPLQCKGVSVDSVDIVDSEAPDGASPAAVRKGVG
jgi:hypothetical protein